MVWMKAFSSLDANILGYVVVWRDDEYKTVMKGNDSGRWSFDDMVFWLERRQNEDTVKW
jgi:hypothetical protein